MGQTIKDQKLGSVLARNQDFAKGEEPELQVKKFYKNIKIGRHGKQISATQSCHRRRPGGKGYGSLGAKPSAAGQFFRRK